MARDSYAVVQRSEMGPGYAPGDYEVVIVDDLRPADQLIAGPFGDLVVAQAHIWPALTFGKRALPARLWPEYAHRLPVGATVRVNGQTWAKGDNEWSEL